MATLRQSTTCNRPRISDSEGVKELLSDYVFRPGTHGKLNINVQTNESDNTVLSIMGYCGFNAYPAPYDPEADPFEEPHEECTREFLKELSEYLIDPFIVETIGREKLRLPLLAYQYKVWPNGDIQMNSFDHTRDPPTISDILEDASFIDASNDLGYLLKLIHGAIDCDDHFENDSERAEWVIAQWCQELQFSPDLREYEVGETVPKSESIEDLETAKLREANADSAE